MLPRLASSLLLLCDWSENHIISIGHSFPLQIQLLSNIFESVSPPIDFIWYMSAGMWSIHMVYVSLFFDGDQDHALNIDCLLGHSCSCDCYYYVYNLI